MLRVKKGYRSLPEAINARYGPLATVAFGEARCLPLFPGFLGRSYYQPVSCETQHAFSKALPFAAGPPQTSVDKSAFSTHVKFSCICCRVGCALPAVSGDLEQCCGGGSMVWHAGELQAISYTQPAPSDMRSGVPGIDVTQHASQGCRVISDANQTFALLWQAFVNPRKQ